MQLSGIGGKLLDSIDVNGFLRDVFHLLIIKKKVNKENFIAMTNLFVTDHCILNPQIVENVY